MKHFHRSASCQFMQCHGDEGLKRDGTHKTEGAHTLGFSKYVP